MKMPNIAVLPTLVTLGNAIAGFVAIGILVKHPHEPIPGGDPAEGLAWLSMAGYLIFLAMIFDALDGRVARFARATSDFGGQLDSLCDALSFGAAPALLVYRVVVDTLPGGAFHRLAMIFGAVYFACTALRLARFNVENVHDEEAHMAFRGLPSPAAAGALASLVILVASLWRNEQLPGVARALVWMLPVATLLLGVLMVSTVRYVHLLNHLIRGRRPLGYFVQIALCIALVVFLQEKALAPLFVLYVLSGPAILFYRKTAHAVRHAHSRGAAPRRADQDDDAG